MVKMETLADGMEKYPVLERNEKKLKRVVNALKVSHGPVFFLTLMGTLLGSGPCRPLPRPPH